MVSRVLVYRSAVLSVLLVVFILGHDKEVCSCSIKVDQLLLSKSDIEVGFKGYRLVTTLRANELVSTITETEVLTSPKTVKNSEATLLFVGLDAKDTKPDSSNRVNEERVLLRS